MRESIGVCRRPTTKEIYLTVEIATNIFCPLCSEKGWKMTNGTELQTCEPVNYQKWLSITTNH